MKKTILAIMLLAAVGLAQYSGIPGVFRQITVWEYLNAIEAYGNIDSLHVRVLTSDSILIDSLGILEVDYLTVNDSMLVTGPASFDSLVTMDVVSVDSIDGRIGTYETLDVADTVTVDSLVRVGQMDMLISPGGANQFRGHKMGAFVLDNLNDPDVVPADSLGWNLSIVNGTNYLNMMMMFRTGADRNNPVAGEDWIISFTHDNLILQTGVLPPFLGEYFLTIGKATGDMDLVNDFTAGTIEADNGADEAAWVVQAGDTITIVGGVITSIAHP